MQGRTRQVTEGARWRFAALMAAGFMVMAGLAISSVPQASEARVSEARVCMLQISGPLAGSCARR